MSEPLQSEQTPYWCFISYRHADNREQDRSWATWLHQEIERYEVPAEMVGQINPRGHVIPERIYPVFRDEESLPADSDLASTIVNALNRSRFMVVLCSPRAVQSKYVANEIFQFKSQGGEGRIVAAIVDGEPGSDRECFPEPLRHPVGSDGKLDRSVSGEPIAADFRLKDGSEGFTSVEGYRLAMGKDSSLKSREVERRAGQYGAQLQLMKLKVIAGILGVPLEQLRNRDKAYQLQLAQKRTRALRLWLVAVALLTVLAIAGGTFAWFKQQEAVEAQRRTAKEMIDVSWKALTLFTDNTNKFFGDTRSYIFGTRNLYDYLRLFMDLQKLQSLAPVPVFLSGPYGIGATDGSATAAQRDFNFESYDFGHYNPEFVSWAYENLIPAATDEPMRLLTQPFYDKFLREISRYYYIVYLDVQAAEPRMSQEVVAQFRAELEKFKTVPFDKNTMGAGPGHYLQYKVFYQYANQFGGFNTSIFDWSSGKMDFYYSNVAGPFWIRRMMDGTSDGMVSLLRKLLQTYDGEWLNGAPEAKPQGQSGALRFPIEFK